MFKPLARWVLVALPKIIRMIKKKKAENMEWDLARDEMWADVIKILEDRHEAQQAHGMSREARETRKMIKYLKKNKPGAQIRDAVQMRGQ